MDEKTRASEEIVVADLLETLPEDENVENNVDGVQDDEAEAPEELPADVETGTPVGGFEVAPIQQEKSDA